MGGLWDSGKCSKMIAGWLEDKKQRVQLNGHRSGGTEVRCGVLQRSILEPLLFAIFIDDINDEVLCKVSKFADDIRIPSQVNAYNGIRSIYRTLDKLVG